MYFCNLQKLKFNNFLKKKDTPLDREIEKYVFEDLDFFVPKTNNYSYEKFENLNKFFINFFNKHSYPGVFIDIGAFVGLYSFVINRIYSNQKKKLVLYSFEPAKYSFNLLKKNTSFENHTAYNFGVSNTEKKTYISIPRNYYSNFLSKNLKLRYSMKSVNEKKGYNSEEVELITLLKILKPDEIEKAHLKIDVEGSEMEVVRYLDENNLYPKSLSIELNNHYIYKRFLTLNKILGKNFKRKYNMFVIHEKDSSNLVETNINIINRKILFKENENLIKNLFYPKVNSFDLYLVKKTK